MELKGSSLEGFGDRWKIAFPLREVAVCVPLRSSRRSEVSCLVCSAGPFRVRAPGKRPVFTQGHGPFGHSQPCTFKFMAVEGPFPAEMLSVLAASVI